MIPENMIQWKKQKLKFCISIIPIAQYRIYYYKRKTLRGRGLKGSSLNGRIMNEWFLFSSLHFPIFKTFLQWECIYSYYQKTGPI